MAWTQQDLSAIEGAIATGAKRVRFQTHEVEYQTVSDMLKVRDLIKADIAEAAGLRSGGAIYAEYGSDY